jgi:Zn ribbon nucleic-acid-binding protein
MKCIQCGDDLIGKINKDDKVIDVECSNCGFNTHMDLVEEVKIKWTKENLPRIFKFKTGMKDSNRVYTAKSLSRYDYKSDRYVVMWVDNDKNLDATSYTIDVLLERLNNNWTMVDWKTEE